MLPLIRIKSSDIQHGNATVPRDLTAGQARQWHIPIPDVISSSLVITL